MLEQNDFNQFYEEQLKQKLDKIEDERRVQFDEIESFLKKWRKIAGAVGLLIGITVVLLAGFTFFESIKLFALCFGISALLVYFIGVYNNYNKKQKKLHELITPFKEKIITPLLAYFNPSLTYYPEDWVSEEELASSLLFQQKISHYAGDDLITGKFDDTDFRFSELQIAQKCYRSDSHGHTQLVNVNFFEGIFMVAQFSFHLEGTTFILPDWENKKKEDTYMANMDYKKKRRQNLKENLWIAERVPGVNGLKKITLNEDDFDPYFRIYSTHPKETRQLLRNGLKKQLLLMRELGHEPNTMHQVDYKKVSNYEERAVYLSLINNTLYLGKPYNRPFFNPNLSMPINNPAITRQCFRDIKLMVQLVKSLRNSVGTLK